MSLCLSLCLFLFISFFSQVFIFSIFITSHTRFSQSSSKINGLSLSLCLFPLSLSLSLPLSHTHTHTHNYYTLLSLPLPLYKVIYPLKDLQLIGKVCLPKSVNRTKLEVWVGSMSAMQVVALYFYIMIIIMSSTLSCCPSMFVFPCLPCQTP